MIGLHDTGERVGYSMQTFTRRLFWPADPRPEEVTIEDIAHALANICRFGGHVSRFYSVAQHSVLVSMVCEAEHALWGLLHDAAEAYVGDMVRPIKKLAAMSAYGVCEQAVQNAICTKFGMPIEQPESVKVADNCLLATELRDVMRGAVTHCIDVEPLALVIIPWDPIRAESEFRNRFRAIVGGT